ncbi:MAG: META domain-containing protein [Chloroflexi bacterium]|nr:META domain-containing protein [Chloroflexota bacterium]MBP7042927.1 META domain-containing protein [Chloroflexota bacterium]
MKKRSNWLLLTLLVAGMAVLVACGGNPQPAGPEQTLFVGPNLVECTGVAPQTCMQVKDTPDGDYRLFYDQIQGFVFEEGFEYELRVRTETVENPAADASSLRYILVEEVSKTPMSAASADTTADGQMKILYVGPELVDCVGVAPQQCMQVKENQADEYTLFYGQIEGFTFEPGYEYELQVKVETVDNPPADGSSLKYTLVAVVSQTPVGGTAPAVVSEASSLTGTLWRLQSYQGTAVTAGTEITAVFGEDGSLVGSSGCNNYNTSFTVDGSVLTINPIMAATMMACEDTIMQQEMAYLAALPTATAWAVAADTLTLSDASGAALLVYTAVTPTSLTGTTWQLTGYNNGVGGVVSLVEGSEITAVFGEDGTLSGNSGCNNYSTSFTVDSGSIAIDAAIASTMMACPEELMTQEAAYLAALPNANVYQIQADTLELRDADGALLAQYTAVTSANLTGITWLLTGYNNGNDAVVSAMSGVEVTAVFGEDGTLSGTGGCNNYSTSYTLDGSALAINSAIASTMMACAEDVMAQETAFLAALPTATTYTIQGDALELRDANGALVASFTSAPPAATTLVGAEWMVTVINNGNQAAVSLVGGTEITMMFGEDGNVQGSASCNQYFGPYTVSGDTISVGPLATTRAYCPEPEGIMDQEAQFLKALQTAVSYTIQNGALDMRTADGAIAVMASSGSIAAAPAGGDTAVAAPMVAMADAAAAPADSRQEALANATFLTSILPAGSVTLSGGQYSEPAAPGSASAISVMLTDKVAFGEINGQTVAAVVLVSSGGGTGNFYELALVSFESGQPVNVAETFLGDRVQVNSLSIDPNGVISIDMITHGPNDPMCCPTQPVVNTYELQNGGLVQTASTPKV